MLPEIRNVTPQRLNFPAPWQAVLFRNYRMVPAENIAAVLGCDTNTVHREAARLGLSQKEYDPDWLTRGYITIIRSNWYLLPYEQLLTLLNFSKERLDFVLEKDDFLWVKLGHYKPDCPVVRYAPLTEEQEAKTAEIAALVSRYDHSDRKYFDFFRDETDTEPVYFSDPNGSLRLVHPFLTPCADAFIEDTRSHLPDQLLDAYAKFGVNALLIHGVLSSLSPYPFQPELSKDYPLRRKHLRDLIERAGKRGIKIYLYLNEPRALPKDIFDAYGRPDLGGSTTETTVALCLEHKENRLYLYNAMKDLFTDIPEIGGVLSITKSENATHCTYSKTCNCPICSKLPVEEMPPLVNNIMMQAIRDSGSKAEMIASLWQWSPDMGWSDKQIARAIGLLDKDITVCGLSEFDLAIEKADVKGRVIDYSISNPGPSEVTRKALFAAKEYGHKIMAKVQVSNSWEMSCIPYLPAFELELEHLNNLRQIGVNDFMLTWTLGGYPSITYDLISEYLNDPEHFDLDRWYHKLFGEYAGQIKEAVHLFCEGFREYPFSCAMLYNSPKNLGPANLWSLEPDNKNSTMVCWSFDDYETWCAQYPAEVYLSQFKKTITAWEESCNILGEAAHDDLTEELRLYTRVSLLHARADYIHTRYAIVKRELPARREEMREILMEEQTVAEKLLSLIKRSPLIGYETSNHYFYTERDLIEKLIQIKQLLQEL